MTIRNMVTQEIQRVINEEGYGDYGIKPEEFLVGVKIDQDFDLNKHLVEVAFYLKNGEYSR